MFVVSWWFRTFNHQFTSLVNNLATAFWTTKRAAKHKVKLHNVKLQSVK